MPRKPTAENKLAALMMRQAILEGHKEGALPEVGERISIKPQTVQAIRTLASKGYHCTAIARELGLWESGVRRYAKDYGIAIPRAGMVGGPSEAKLKAIDKRRALVLRLLGEGWTQRAVAKKLRLSTFTINQDAQYVRSKRKGAALWTS